MKIFAYFLCLLFLVQSSFAGLTPVVQELAETQVKKGAAYLVSKQNDGGSWGPYGGLPAITALAVTALSTSKEANTPEVKAAVAKATEYLKGFINADGSIWDKSEKGYPNYTTSLATVAFYVSDQKAHKDIILKARRWLKSSQFTATSGATTLEEGGIGYGSTKTKSDLSNTQMALEALYITHDVEDEASPEDIAATKECWKNVEKFLNRCQASPTTNDQKWAKESPGEDIGGFIYSPDRTKVEDEAGNADSLRVYGSMTYAGLKSMIYAGMMNDDKFSKNDPRISAAVNWAAKNYTMDENPGVGAQGHFYYIHTMTKALHVYGADTLTDKNSIKRNWKADVITKLASLQSKDGSWINAEGRWMENVPEMVTAYSLMSLNYTLNKDLR